MYTIRILLLSLLVVSGASASPKWLRRAAAIGVCAAQAFDAGTTIYAVNHGFRETNAVFSDSGRLRVAWFGLAKGGMCAGSLALARWRKLPAPAVLALTAPNIAIETRAGFKNLGVIRRGAGPGEL